MNRLAALCQAVRALVVAALAGGSIGAIGAGARAQQAQLDPDTAAWEAARAAGTAAACQNYLEQFPAGRHAEQAFRCIVEQAIPGAGPPAGDEAAGGGGIGAFEGVY